MLVVLAPEPAVRACRRPRFIAAVGAVAVLVVDLGHGNFAAPVHAVEVSCTRVEPARREKMVKDSEMVRLQPAKSPLEARERARQSVYFASPPTTADLKGIS